MKYIIIQVFVNFYKYLYAIDVLLASRHSSVDRRRPLF
jgi:hypothetical protein